MCYDRSADVRFDRLCSRATSGSTFSRSTIRANSRLRFARRKELRCRRLWRSPKKSPAGIRKLEHVDYTLMTIGDDQQRTQNQAKIYVKLAPISRIDRSPSSRSWGRCARRSCRNSSPTTCARSLRRLRLSAAAAAHNADVSLYVARTKSRSAQSSIRSVCSINSDTCPGVVDADTSLIVGKPELRASIDRQKAVRARCRHIATSRRSLRLLVGGDQVSTYNENGEQYEVHVRANRISAPTPNGISRLNVPSSAAWAASGWTASRICDEGTGPTQIERASPSAAGDADRQSQTWLFAKRRSQKTRRRSSRL